MKSFIKPGIVLGLGIGCMIMSTLEGIIYAPDAKEAIEEKKKELNVEKLSIVDTIRTGGPYMAPCAAAGITGIVCILTSTNKMINIGAGAMAACTLAETTTRELREKTKELVGSKKNKQIQEAIAEDSLAKCPKANREVIITGRGNSLCFDKLTGKYFRSNIDSIQKIENKLNSKLNKDDVVTVNEYCWALGISPVKLGDETGWTRYQGLLEFNFTGGISDDGEPCIIVDININPVSI